MTLKRTMMTRTKSLQQQLFLQQLLSLEKRQLTR